MKKAFVSTLALMIFSVCCLFGVSVYGAEHSITADDIQLSCDTYVYSGVANKPGVNVIVDGITLVENQDYTVRYKNNVNSGTAYVVVDGLGEYAGINVNKEFTINRRNLNSQNVKFSISRAVVDSSNAITATYNDKKLYINKDYKIASKDLSKIGAKAGKYVMSGIGNYVGQITVKCDVYPQKVTDIKAVKKTTDSVKISWKSQKKYGIDKYNIYLCDKDGKNKKYYKTVSTNTFTFDNLKPGEYVFLYIKACKQIDGKKYYSSYSDRYTTCSRPSKAKIVSISNGSGNSYFTVKWNKVSCTGYEIKIATNKDFTKGVKTYKVYGSSKTSKRINLNAKNTYYIKVRAFRRYDNKKKICNGKWSRAYSNRYGYKYVSYTTSYAGSSSGRCTNIELAAKKINGTVLYPGDTFSFDAVVGKRTADRGFKKAPAFTGPTGHDLTYGGGVCQVSSTLFNAVLYGNLHIVERHPHSQRVGYVPLGRDAAINWGTKNFRFSNNTKYPIKIVMITKDSKLKCRIMTITDIKHPEVELKVEKNGKNFTLNRYVAGKVNYTASSYY